MSSDLMHRQSIDSMSEPIIWQDDGCPHSPRFGDRYYSCAGAIEQETKVFLAGCGLPVRWRGQ